MCEEERSDSPHIPAHGFSRSSVVGPLQGQPDLWEAEQGSLQNLRCLEAEAEGLQGRLGRWVRWACFAQLALTGSHPPEGKALARNAEAEWWWEPVAKLGVEGRLHGQTEQGTPCVPPLPSVSFHL